MTRHYWTNHKNFEGLITVNSHIAALIINSFRQTEIPMHECDRYRIWKTWLIEHPKPITPHGMEIDRH